jgi:hypothetical protein
MALLDQGFHEASKAAIMGKKLVRKVVWVEARRGTVTKTRAAIPYL